MAMDAELVQVGAARRPGTEPPCADAYDVQRTGDRVTTAVVDGAGHDPDTVRYAALAPAVITHLGATLGGLAAVITAGQMARAYDAPPHVSAVYARMSPKGATGLVWIGDCRAYGWADDQLTQWSTDQTMGQFLRWHGDVPAEIAGHHDEWARLGLAQATAATVREAQIPQALRLVLLVTDGVSDQVGHTGMEALCRTHGAAPQAMADALVTAAAADAEGYRDDATAVVLLRTE